VRLLCANRFYRDVEWFLAELRALKEEFPEFSVMFLFSRENATSSSSASSSSSSLLPSSSSSLLQPTATVTQPTANVTQSPWQCGVILQGTRVDPAVLKVMQVVLRVLKLI